MLFILDIEKGRVFGAHETVVVNHKARDDLRNLIIIIYEINNEGLDSMIYQLFDLI